MGVRVKVAVDVGVPVGDGVKVGVSVGVCVDVGVKVAVADGVGVWVAVVVSVGVMDGVSVAVAVMVDDGVTVGVSVGVADGVCVAVADGVMVGVAVGVFVHNVAVAVSSANCISNRINVNSALMVAVMLSAVPVALACSTTNVCAILRESSVTVSVGVELGSSGVAVHVGFWSGVSVGLLRITTPLT